MNQSNQPLVSVVIPCYNHEHFVQDCIQSVIDQTYENIELIIIDDGSKDRSVEKIQEMIFACEKRFKRFEFRYRPNKGLSRTLNEALVWCEGEYYSPFASDDIMFVNKIEIQVKYLELNIQCAGVFGAFQIIDNDGVVIGLRKKNTKKYKFEDIFLHRHELPAPTQLLRTHLVKEVGCYPENILIEDWYMWLRMTELKLSLNYVDNILVKYRRHENNTSKKLDIMMESRSIIIERFKSHYLYNDALACAYLVSANDYISIDKGKSWNFYLKFRKIKNKGNYFASFKYVIKITLSFFIN